MTAYNKYLNSLEQCKLIARKEYQYVGKYFAECDVMMHELQLQFTQVVAQARNTLSDERMLDDGLIKLLYDLQTRYSELKAQRNQHLAAMKRTLSHFNVMLFGRTMAGKSTIREAITGGDGSSIGKGAQRTTRDVREYEWNNLRIIDTPGFGAYGGEKDTQIARGILEQSDVVLFMLNSDSIQESTFHELEYVRKLNKPLIFVLNMKKDLEHDGNRRRALNNPEKYIYKAEDIAGHTERLQELASRAGMHPGHIRIIPIHAQAAYLCTKTQGEESAQLRTVSQLDELLTVLCEEVEFNGPVRRVQTFLDSGLDHINQQMNLLLQQKDHLDKLLPEYQSTLSRIVSWRKKLARDAPQMIASEVNSAYKPLVDSIGDFLDTHIENRNIGRHWQKHCQSFNISQEIEDSAQALAEQVIDELADFTREMNESIEINASIEISNSGNSFDEWDYKRLGGWGSAIAGVISTIAFSNSWNPVGWTAAALAIGFTLFALFSDSKHKKLREAKNRAREDLLASLKKNREEIIESLGKWFAQKIVTEAIQKTEGNLDSLQLSIHSLSKSIKCIQHKLDALQQNINSRLLYRVAHIISGKHQTLPEIHKVVRTPGYATYFLISDYFRNKELLKSMNTVLRETVLAVYNTPLENKIQYLFNGLTETIEIKANNEVNIYARPENIPKIHGKQHRRINMAAAICSCKINTITLK